MILIVLALLALQTAPAAPPAPQEAPADLGPAMKPYLGCLLGSRGMDVPDVGTAAFAPGTDCTAQRAKSAREGEAFLAGTGTGTPEQHRAYIENMLAEMDRMAATLPPVGTTVEKDGTVVVDRVIATPLLPSALREPVGHYSACVREGFTRELKLAHPVRNGADSRAPFAKAKAGCAEARALATAEADVILTPTESDPGKRAAVIAAALDTVDAEGDSFAAAADEAAARYKASNPQE